MLDLELWKDLVLAYVRVEAARCGFNVHSCGVSKSSESTYLELRAGSCRAVIRVSDHRPSSVYKQRDSMLSIRRNATGRVRELRPFLDRRLRGAALMPCSAACEKGAAL